MDKLEMVRTYVEALVKGLVVNPDAVTVETVTDDRGICATINADPSDMGRIIGKEGQNARALRTLARCMGGNIDARIGVKIFDPRPHPSGESAPLEDPTELKM